MSLGLTYDLLDESEPKLSKLHFLVLYINFIVFP